MRSRASEAPLAKNKTFRIPLDLASRAEAKARRSERSLNSVIVDLLRTFVGTSDEDEFFARIGEINDRARRRRGGKRLAPAPAFTRDELHER